MNRRLAAAKLHNLWVAFQLNETVEHALNFSKRQTETVLSVSEANRAIQIAVAVYFNQCHAGVLLVFRTKATIERATVLHLCTEFEGHRAWLIETSAAYVTFRIGTDQTLEPTVLGTAFAHIYAVVTQQHLRVDNFLALGADAAGQLMEYVVGILLDRRLPVVLCHNRAGVLSPEPPMFSSWTGISRAS